MALDAKEFRNAMGHFATGVTVVTTLDKNGQPTGITANAFTSVSLNPPLVLVCIDKNAQCRPSFDESKAFAVNILSRGQEELSRRFATKGIDKFVGVRWHPGYRGLPLIDGTLGQIECDLVQSYDGGDHTIYVGEVVNVSVSPGDPLLFYRGRYHRLGEPELAG
jgi:flavin reductase (DIM6/NTAB) family NADH-FMN oxidoreductase RutF